VLKRCDLVNGTVILGSTRDGGRAALGGPLGSESGRPIPRGRLIKAGDRMTCTDDVGEDVGGIGSAIDIVQLAGFDDRREDSAVLAASI
jgi:hypothetical protein